MRPQQGGCRGPLGAILLLGGIGPGCSEGPGPGAADSGAAALPDPVAEGPARWSIGAVEPCEGGRTDPGYVDVSDRLDDARFPWPTTIGEPIDGGPGVIAVVEAPEGPVVLAALLDDTLLRVPLAGGEATRTEVAQLPYHLEQADLDGDGRIDVIAAERPPRVTWAFGAAEEVDTVLSIETDHPHLAIVTPLRLDDDDAIDLIGSWRFGAHGVDPPAFTLRNGGDRTFTFAELSAVDPGFWGQPFSVDPIDLDDDADLDVYLCNDAGAAFGPNGLLQNDGAGALTPATDPRGLDVTTNCMGAAFGDVNADGALDVYVTSAGEVVLLQQLGGAFVNVTEAVGLPAMSLAEMGWGGLIVDVDNDGLPDLPTTRGDFISPEPVCLADEVFRQDAPDHFTAVGAEWGLPAEACGRGALARDWNGDGVVDLLFGDAFRSPYLLLSSGCSAGSWLEVRAPDHSIVTVTGGGHTWAAVATTRSSYGASGPPVAHLGLGDLDTIEQIDVAVPGQGHSTLTGPMSARRRITVE